MKKNILQIETTQSSEFIPKLLKGFKILLEEHTNELKDPEILLTREEAAEMLSISKVTLWRWTSDNIIPAYRIGTKVRYKKSEILLALKQMNQF